jgi:Tn3 transposase DDE domain
MRERSYEDQAHRASERHPPCATTALRNIVDFGRAVEALKRRGVEIAGEHIEHTSSLGWEHVAEEHHRVEV